MAKHQSHHPLKIGIAADVQERCSDIDRRDLVAALAAYTHRVAYLQAIVVGADRIDLDGVMAGQVTAAETEHAAAVLAGIMGRRQAQCVPPAGPVSLTPTPTGLKGKPVLHLRLGEPR